ncbi:MAG: hypothetical protein LBR83_09355 [Clostridiales bacterium]|jgi:CotS family spore coat protein|nr:hypothetical protein [Clostridiales bacterium]
MGELNSAVLKQFGLRVGKVSREKAYFICETPEGAYRVSKTADTPGRIFFMHELKERLTGAGFPWVDRYAVALTGEPFATAGGDRYVMTAFTPRRESDFTDFIDFSRVVEAVARWHSLARAVDFSPKAAVMIPAQTLPEIFRKQTSELAATRKRVSRQARLSDFDVLFIKNANHYMAQMNKAAAALEATGYGARKALALSEKHICHNSLKEEYLPVSGEQVWVTHYSEACVDLQLIDLCGLIRRYVQRTGLCARPLANLLEIYSRFAPLGQGDVEILRAMLLYPYPFIKITSQYYSKKRSWTPNAITNRMQQALLERDIYEKYI